MPTFRAVPCREDVNGTQSYSIYKNDKPFIRPAEGQIIDSAFARQLVKCCEENKTPEVAKGDSPKRDDGGPAIPRPAQLPLNS